MATKQEITSLPRALAETLARGHAEYEAVLRRTRWGEGPIYLLGSGTCQFACLTGVLTLETLVGWPAVARSLAAFAAYSTALLKPGAVVIAVSPCSESPTLDEVARAARARGASLLILTNNPDSTFAKIAAGVLRLSADSKGSGRMVGEQAAMSYLGLLAGRIFKKHRPEFETLEEDFGRLSRESEGVLRRMPDALSTLSCELAAFRTLYVLGGGFYHPTALQTAYLFQEAGIGAQAMDPMELGSLDFRDQKAVLLACSGSRCRVRKRVHEVLKQAGDSGVKIVSITDSNDRELTQASAVTVLLPAFSELVGSILTSTVIHWLAYQTACHLGRTNQGKPRAGATGEGPGGPQGAVLEKR